MQQQQFKTLNMKLVIKNNAVAALKEAILFFLIGLINLYGHVIYYLQIYFFP